MNTSLFLHLRQLGEGEPTAHQPTQIPYIAEEAFQRNEIVRPNGHNTQTTHVHVLRKQREANV